MKSLSFLAILVCCLTALAGPDHYSQGELGERDGGLYAGPWRPEFTVDPYFGRLEHNDDQFWQNFFFRYLWKDAPEVTRFLGSELSGAATCPNETLAVLANDLRYGYRLVALSFLLESIDALRRDATLLKRATACTFELQQLLKSCRPQSQEMRTFVKGLMAQHPFSGPTVDQSHNFSKYEREWLAQISKEAQLAGVARVRAQCLIEGRRCSAIDAALGTELLGRACEQDKALVTQVCSEEDQLYGFSTLPMMSQLLASSNLMSIYNADGYGIGCLRRFGQLMAGHERIPGQLRWSLPVIRAELSKNFGKRYPLGRAFVYGALKEFRNKGLGDLFEPKVVEPVPAPAKAAPVPVELPQVPPPVIAKAPESPVVVAPTPKPVPPKPKEVELDPKSAFLLASEIRRGQQLERVDVDMLKFRYDYVFNAAELRLLAETLKDYTSREALKEMQTFDKLGTNEAPVPLTFLKYLIDSENHQGLYNLTGILGESFWVNNDVDVKWKPRAEFVELKNDESTARQWQLYIIQVD